MNEAAVMNEAFVRDLKTKDGQEKVSQLGTDYIRDRMRENSFVEKILKEQNVNRSDPQITISTVHDTLGYLCEIQPNSRAMPITLRGEPTGELVQGKRFVIAFYGIATAEYQAYELELMAYTMPIVKIIQQQADQDIGDIRDRDFIVHVEGAVQAMQDTVPANTLVEYTSYEIYDPAGTAEEVSIFKGQLAAAAFTGAADARDFTVYPIHRNDIIRFDQFLGADGGDRQLALAVLLMTTTDYDDVMRWTTEDLGDTLTSEWVRNGIKANQLFGWKVVRTIKSRILRRGNIYGFTAPEYIGKFLRLRPVKFEAKQEFDRIRWKSWEIVGMGIGNVASIIKCELYPGSVKPAFPNPGYEEKIPKAVEDMFEPTHKVEDGIVSPVISQY